MVVFALWIAHRRSTGRSVSESLKNTLDSAFSNSVRFTKAHFTGGVGAILKPDPVTGIPIIIQIVAGSPAEKAGLRKDDAIIQVDGVPTKGQLLAQTVDRMRGFAAGSVTLTIQRQGSTNLQFIIHRSSWNSLGLTNSNPP
jgi:C-terminal processing protease CtpA/Prc